MVVNGEYDGWADFPDRPWNLVSLVNALLGIAYVHGGYETIPGGLDLSTVPPANITTSTNSLGGTTTVSPHPDREIAAGAVAARHRCSRAGGGRPGGAAEGDGRRRIRAQ